MTRSTKNGTIALLLFVALSAAASTAIASVSEEPILSHTNATHHRHVEAATFHSNESPKVDPQILEPTPSFSSKNETKTPNRGQQTTKQQPQQHQQAPQWMIDFIAFRKRLFLRTVEPIIVFLLGPLEEEISTSSTSIATASSNYYVPDYDPDLDLDLEEQEEWQIQYHSHRRLSFLPNYVEDVKYFKETSMSFATLVMLFSLLFCLFIIFLSCFYHNQKTSPLFISPRRHRLPKLVPPPLPVDGYFKWVKICFFLSDQEIIYRVGYDSLIFIRFHRLALRCIVKMSVFSFVVLLPLNFTGGGHANAKDLKAYMGSLFFTDFLRFTMANVSGGSPRLWVHCFAAYLLTAIVVRELLKEYETFNSIRHTYLLSREPHLRTVLVSNIPRHLRSRSKINSYFRHVYPQAVQQVVLCQNVMELEDLVRNRTSVLSQLEKELLLLCRMEKYKLFRPQQQRRQLCGSCYGGPTCCCCSTSASASWNMALQHVLRMRHCLERLQLVPGTQERLTKLYTNLEQLNQEIEQEQRRRRRVMKMLDRMEASGEGSREIDYLLTLSHDNDNKKKKKSKNPLKRLGLVKGKRQNTTTHNSVAPPPPPPPPPPPQQQEPDEQTMEQNNSKNGVLRARSPVHTSTSNSNNNTAADDTEGDHIGKKSKVRSMTKARLGMQKLGRMMGSAVSTNTTSAAAEAYMPPPSEDYPASPPPPPMSPENQDAAHQNGANMESNDHYQYMQDEQDGGPPSPSRNSVGSGKQAPPVPKSPTPHIEDHLNEVCDKAFVVMQTFTAATIAIQSMHSSRPGSMQVTTAPEPRDILWNNIYVSKGATRTRSYLGEALVLLIITFYVVPVALVSLLVSESALVSSSPRLEQLDQASAFFSSSIAMVQPLCIVGIQQLLPPLFMYIGRVEGLASFSEVQMRAFSRYFLFQVLNIFLVTTVAGSIFDTIAIIVETPEAAFEMLGNSLPRMSSFFITFVTMKTFLGLGTFA